MAYSGSVQSSLIPRFAYPRLSARQASSRRPRLKSPAHALRSTKCVVGWQASDGQARGICMPKRPLTQRAPSLRLSGPTGSANFGGQAKVPWIPSPSYARPAYAYPRLQARQASSRRPEEPVGISRETSFGAQARVIVTHRLSQV